MAAREYVSKLSDGRIAIFRRNGAPTLHARIKLPDHTGYIIQTLKTQSLAEAASRAQDLYDDLRLRLKQGLSVGRYTFEDVWKLFIENEGKKQLSSHRQRFLEGTADRYFLPYFGEKNVTEISDLDIDAYWDWRLAFWDSPAGLERIAKAARNRGGKGRRDSKPTKRRSKLGNVKRKPSNKTLQMEQTALKQIFGWAHRRSLINRVPYIKAPRDKAKPTVERRPAFALGEYMVLVRKMRRWAIEVAIAQPTDKAGKFESSNSPLPRPHSLHRWQREMLRNYVLFVVSSGLRPNEARQLRWRDIREIEVSQIKDDEVRLRKFVVVTTSAHTKTGVRDVVCHRHARSYLDRLKALSSHTGPSDLVFADREGNAVQFFGKTFKKLLSQTWVLYGNDDSKAEEVSADAPGAHCILFDPITNQERTIYSLRHTYATFRLRYGRGGTYDKLARNMGTSPAMIFKHYHHATVQQDAEILGL